MPVQRGRQVRREAGHQLGEAPPVAANDRVLLPSQARSRYTRQLAVCEVY
jgi:hypothetical protein